MGNVKILEMTNTRDLQGMVQQYLDAGYRLVGPVAACVDGRNGNMRYVATLILEEK